MSDEIDPTITPDPDDPGDDYTLPETTDDDDTPVDPDADQSPDCNDEEGEA